MLVASVWAGSGEVAAAGSAAVSRTRQQAAEPENGDKKTEGPAGGAVGDA